MKNYLAIIITHGKLALEMNNVSQNFLPLSIPVFTYSNQEKSIETIIGDVNKEIEKINPDKIIIFVDLLGGSCWHAAMGVKKNQLNCAIITGVNIPILVSFTTNFEKLDWPQLLEKLDEDGKKAIKIVQ